MSAQMHNISPKSVTNPHLRHTRMMLPRCHHIRIRQRLVDAAADYEAASCHSRHRAHVAVGHDHVAARAVIVHP